MLMKCPRFHDQVLKNFLDLICEKSANRYPCRYTLTDERPTFSDFAEAEVNTFRARPSSRSAMEVNGEDGTRDTIRHSATFEICGQGVLITIA